MRKRLRWSGLSSERLLTGLLLLYLISTALLEFPLYPAWSHRVQPPELMFALAGLLVFRLSLRAPQGITLSWSYLDAAVGLYLLVNLAAAAIHPEHNALLEVLGKCYLAGVYLLFKVALQNRWLDWPLLLLGFQVLAVVLIFTILLAYLLWFQGWDTSLLARFIDYPYFGTIYRAKGTLQTPSMFISIVNWCFLFIYTDGLMRGFGRQTLFLLMGLWLVGVLSFAKAGLFLFFLIIAGFACFRYGKRGTLLILPIATITAIVYLLITNFVYIKAPMDTLIANNFLGVAGVPPIDEPIWLPTCYFAFKEAAWEMGSRHLWLGVGPGNFITDLADLQQAGLYPAHLPLHDPHSVLFGAFAETGILGLLSLILLFVLAFVQLRRLHHREPFYIALFIGLLIFIMEGLNGDLMNFRHYWISLGLIGGLGAYVEAKPTTPA